MNVQVIERDGEPEYAVLPWAEYLALLQAAGKPVAAAPPPPVADAPQPLAQLLQLRENKGLSRDELARAVGISPHYLSMIERGERQPDAAILRALAWVLGISGWEAHA
ncbi:Helix-turn-helix [Pseudomonas flavescens]|uniref:Helix-turn-helix n=1 Tax=Phytopseudomonas flavescens TaxID=29435 RepID=A0A1G7XZM9_9GAMM|nr:helix-turn-helix transcriptional regulator [Pseudomonas flavescens]SDG89692.1 Helix-turn-helix [Pseudomonas flavescens]